MKVLKVIGSVFLIAGLVALVAAPAVAQGSAAKGCGEAGQARCCPASKACGDAEAKACADAEAKGCSTQTGCGEAEAKACQGDPCEWISLFSGECLGMWQNARKPDALNQWSIEDGTMTNADHANNTATKGQFKDFDLRLEYKIVKNGNSGVYLRGRIEVQILDSYGKKEVSQQDNGAIYGKVAPLVNASKPAGEWNLLETSYVGDTLNVSLNGMPIHTDLKITELTGGALRGGVDDPGPLMLQGDHGKIWFRNIQVRPRSAGCCAGSTNAPACPKKTEAPACAKSANAPACAKSTDAPACAK